MFYMVTYFTRSVCQTTEGCTTSGASEEGQYIRDRYRDYIPMFTVACATVWPSDAVIA